MRKLALLALVAVVPALAPLSEAKAFGWCDRGYGYSSYGYGAPRVYGYYARPRVYGYYARPRVYGYAAPRVYGAYYGPRVYGWTGRWGGGWGYAGWGGRRGGWW